MTQTPFRAWIKATCALACLLVTSACVTPTDNGTVPAPAPLPEPGPAVTPPDSDAQIQAAYYRRIQSTYLAQGRLRTDGGGADTPFTPDDLARNFIAIAFFDEFSDRGGRLVAGGRETRLHRWTGPIRVALEFGPSAPPDIRRADEATVRAYLARLSRLTGLAIGLDAQNPNFLILAGHPTERRAARPRILAFAPETSASALNSAVAMQPATYCTVFGYSTGKTGTYTRALALVRAELPDLMRQSCYQEEIAQGLGLVNDSPRARPSIFNDNAEFAYLTRQDELLLKLLYDPRLRPGMTLAEARPIIAIIAAELMPGAS